MITSQQAGNWSPRTLMPTAVSSYMATKFSIPSRDLRVSLIVPTPLQAPRHCVSAETTISFTSSLQKLPFRQVPIRWRFVSSLITVPIPHNSPRRKWRTSQVLLPTTVQNISMRTDRTTRKLRSTATSGMRKRFSLSWLNRPLVTFRSVMESSISLSLTTFA